MQKLNTCSPGHWTTAGPYNAEKYVKIAVNKETMVALLAGTCLTSERSMSSRIIAVHWLSIIGVMKKCSRVAHMSCLDSNEQAVTDTMQHRSPWLGTHPAAQQGVLTLDLQHP